MTDILSVKLSRTTSSNILSTGNVDGLKKLRSTVSRVSRDAPLTFKVCLWVLFEDLTSEKRTKTRWLSEKVDLIFDLEGDAYVTVPFYGANAVILDLIGSLALSLGTEALIRKKIVPASFRAIRQQRARGVCRTFGIDMDCDAPILEALCANIVLP
jgi:hypothetical protein